MASPGLPEDITAGVTTGHVTDHEKIHDLLNEFDSAAQAEATGDLLVFQDGLIKRLPVGSNNQVLTADDQETAGVKWATPAGFTFGGTVYFTESGTFTKADYPGLRAVFVRMVGGGGAGGGAPNTGAGQSSGGDGGGGGGYREALILAEELADEEPVVVGQGGIGVARSTGGDGDPSSFGSHMTVGGGGGGIARGPTTDVVKLAGPVNQGTAGTGKGFGMRGNPGDGPYLGASSRGGRGGSSMFGGETVPVNSNNSAGNNSSANNYGGGGAGASKGANNTDPLAGGDGAPGLVIVELWF